MLTLIPLLLVATAHGPAQQQQQQQQRPAVPVPVQCSATEQPTFHFFNTRTVCHCSPRPCSCGVMGPLNDANATFEHRGLFHLMLQKGLGNWSHGVARTAAGPWTSTEPTALKTDDQECEVTDIITLHECVGHIAAGTVLSMRVTGTLQCPDGASHACMDLTAPRSAPLIVSGSAASVAPPPFAAASAARLYRSNYSQPLLEVRGQARRHINDVVHSSPTPSASAAALPAAATAVTTVIRRLVFQDKLWPNCYPKSQPPGPSLAMVTVQEVAEL
jgi:hypothetical protein